MTVDVVSVTPVAARLLRYTVKDKAGQSEPRVLHMAGLNCRPETAEREFATTRRRHGTQSATRMSPAKFELAEPGEVATHVRKTRPNGRRVWAVAKDGETATHVRREGELVRQAEARHLITSFGLDEVNPDDPAQVARAFQYVVDRHAALYPGEQAHFVGQADGKEHKFHVHTVRNATLFADMVVDGKLYKAGSKLAGDLTDIDKIRDRSDAFLNEHYAEYGLIPQRQPSTAERKRETRSTRDRRMAAKGEKSNHDIIRDAFEDSLADPRAADLDSFVEVMQEHDVAVIHRVTRKGKPGETHALSYRLPEMPQNVRGTSLGEYYSYDNAVAQLDANAAGLPREPRPERVEAGPPRPVHVPSDAELAEARAVVARLAADERHEQVCDQIARDLLPAMIEDFDLAGDAARTHDHETVADLARATREREAAGIPHPMADPTDDATTSPEGKAVLLPVVEPVDAEITQPRQPTTNDRMAAMFADIDAAMAGNASMTDEYLKRTRIGRTTAEPADVEAAAPAEVRSTQDRPAEAVPVAIHREAMDELSPQDAEPVSVDDVALALPFRDDSGSTGASASAPNLGRAAASASAPAPASKTVKYRSPLRSATSKSEHTQGIIDQAAVFDEGAHEVLGKGERIDEATVPKGIGAQFLSNYGPLFSPDVQEQLELREKKKRQASKLHELGLVDERDALRAEIRAGVYELVKAPNDLSGVDLGSAPRGLGLGEIGA